MTASAQGRGRGLPATGMDVFVDVPTLHLLTGCIGRGVPGVLVRQLSGAMGRSLRAPAKGEKDADSRPKQDQAAGKPLVAGDKQEARRQAGNAQQDEPDSNGTGQLVFWRPAMTAFPRTRIFSCTPFIQGMSFGRKRFGTLATIV